MTTYANTVEIPSVSPTGTGGAMIIDNFKTLADMVHKTGTGSSAGIEIGGSGNSITGENCVFAGGCNSSAVINDAVVTNSDRTNLGAGGFSFFKSMTMPGYYTSRDSNSKVLEMPAGGYAHIMIQFLNPTLGYVGMTTLEIMPTASGYISPENYDSSYVNFRFYLNNGVLYMEHEGNEIGQFGLWGTVLGAVGSGGTDGGSDTSW